MPVKDALSEEQWNRVVQAPFVAGFAVTAADPGGLIGAFQESSAMAKSLQSADGATTEGSLVHDILAELQSSEGRGVIKDGIRELTEGRGPAEASEAAIARLRETMALVAEHAPEEYAALADLVGTTARNVADAAKEGGFMGFGGVAVSDAEKKALSDIDAVVGAAAPAA